MAQPTRTGRWPVDSVIICLDLECHCRNQSWKEFSQGVRRTERRVSEIGLSSLDTKSVQLDAPGDRASAFWPAIKAFHFAIKEHSHPVKGNHAHWCRKVDVNSFEFGKTSWVSASAVKLAVVNKVRSLIGEPLTARLNTGLVNRRKIVWVYFAKSNDELWLRELGINLHEEFPNSYTVDMQNRTISRVLGGQLRKPQISASDLFAALGIQTRNTHNGGQDAVFELRAYLADMALTDDQVDSIMNWRHLPMLSET